MNTSNIRAHLLAGQVIPAHPLALTAERKFSERHQRALTRYYVAAGVGGIAVGVHSTQFEIRAPEHSLLKPVLELASATVDAELVNGPRGFIKVAGICGLTPQAMQEAVLARSLGYHAGLLSLSAWKNSPEADILQHCRQVAKTIPLIGFYLQPAVGGRVLSYRFWRQFAEIPEVVAIKMAPFNRYQTLDVIRAVADSGREDVALYTGNDDAIITDLLTPFHFSGKTLRIVGGLLGHWGVWTRAAVEMFEALRNPKNLENLQPWLQKTVAVTDMNAAIFDAANQFAGCLPGILEVLRRQGLVPANVCLNPHEALSLGQADEINRVSREYPELTDDPFVAEHLDKWLA